MHKQLEIKNCRTLLNSPIDSVLLIDLYGTVLQINETAARRFRRSVPELIGVNIHDLLPPGLAASRRAFVKKVIDTGAPCRFEDEREGIWYDHILSPVFNDRGDVVNISIWSRDITDRKRVEEQIKESENRFRGAFENAAVGASMVDINGRFLKVNRSLCKMLGYSEAELLTKTFSDITHPDDIQRGLDNLIKQLKGEADYSSFEKRYICKDGRIAHVIVSPSLVRDKMGKPNYFVGLWQDITGHKLVKEALLKAKEELEVKVKERTVELASSVERLQDEIAERRQAEAALLLYQNQIEVVAQIGALANSTLDIGEVLSHILTGTLKATGASVGMIFLRDPETGLLEWGASHGLSETFVEAFRDQVIKPGEGLTGLIARTGEPIYIAEDSSHDPRIARPVVKAEGLNSFIGVPVYAEDKVVAVMNIVTRPPDVLREENIALIKAVGIHAGLAIRNAQLFKELTQAKEELRRAHDELERRVEERTAELKIANETLHNEITQRNHAEVELQKALKESKRREKEILALQRSSHAVLTCRKFGDAARSIFDSCKDIIGASAGYVALLSKDEKQNQVLFLDAGALPCSVNPFLPMPIRGLREKAYQTGRTVYHNEFAGSEWLKYLPEGHVRIDNVLFSPLVIDGKTVGLLGLANKHRGFTEHDAVMASAFGELAAIALINSRTMGELRNSEERLRSVVETANDVIITIDRLGNIVSCNNATNSVFGYSCDEIIGKQLTLLMPERLREFHQRGINRLLSDGEAVLVGRTIEMVALNKYGKEFPIELSIAEWKTAEGAFYTGIVRDITDHKRIEEELKKAKDDLEIKIQKRTGELQSAIGLLQEEVNERKEAERKIMFYQEQLRALMSKLSLAEEQERKRISEHIHDNISQNLAISKMNLESLQEKFPPMTMELKETQELIEQTIKFIRSLTFELSPPILHELGLIAAVEWLADKVQERYGIIVECDTDSRFKALKGETGILLFRTIRELLNNIIKHAKAEHARVSIHGYGDYMEIRVDDDGVGFDASEISDYLIKGESFGIASIRERISYMNGNFEISSSPGEGTKVRIIVPLHK